MTKRGPMRIHPKDVVKHNAAEKARIKNCRIKMRAASPTPTEVKIVAPTPEQATEKSTSPTSQNGIKI